MLLKKCILSRWQHTTYPSLKSIPISMRHCQLSNRYGQGVRDHFPRSLDLESSHPYSTTPECQKQEPGFLSSIRQISPLLLLSLCPPAPDTLLPMALGQLTRLPPLKRGKLLTPSSPDAHSHTHSAFSGENKTESNSEVEGPTEI